MCTPPLSSVGVDVALMCAGCGSLPSTGRRRRCRAPSSSAAPRRGTPAARCRRRSASRPGRRVWPSCVLLDQRAEDVGDRLVERAGLALVVEAGRRTAVTPWVSSWPMTSSEMREAVEQLAVAVAEDHLAAVPEGVVVVAAVVHDAEQRQALRRRSSRARRPARRTSRSRRARRTPRRPRRRRTADRPRRAASPGR